MKMIKKQISLFFQYKDLLKQLVLRDLKLKYRRSFLGYVWSVLNPLLIMIVMTIVFSTLFKREIENFPVYLFTGRMIFEGVTGATSAAMRSIIGNGALIKKCYVPKYIFALAKVTSAMTDFVFSLGALAIVMIFTKTQVTIYVLLAPLVIIQVYIFSCGLGFFLAQFNVFYRDVQQIWRAFTTAWMYATPLFYPIEVVPDKLEMVIKWLNPLYYYIAQFRACIYSGELPAMREFLGGWIIAVLFLVIGIWSFKKNQDKFILYI